MNIRRALMLYGFVATSQLVSAGVLPQQPDHQIDDPTAQNDTLSLAGRDANDYVKLKAIPQNAGWRDRNFQPVMDFDADSCYNAAAIDKDGVLSEGQDPSKTGLVAGCRDKGDLENANVYSRRRCNRGWCAYMYGYYFPKDVGPYASHRHDWEHVVVWTKSERWPTNDGKFIYANEIAQYVAVSAHGNWDVRPVAGREGKKTGGNSRGGTWTVKPLLPLRMHDKTHPKVVYHLSGLITHSIRFAAEPDDKIENASGAWFQGPLLAWHKLPEKTVSDLSWAKFGSAHLALRFTDFDNQLIKTMPAEAKTAGFDCAHDELPASTLG